MKRKKLASALIALTLIGSAHAAKHNVDIKLSRRISKRQRKIINKDLSVLEKHNFYTQADNETLKVLGIEKLTNEVLTKWLEDRVQFVINDTSWDKLEERLEVKQKSFVFDYPTISPTIEESPKAPSGPSKKGVTVMSNIGTALYYAGKSGKVLFSYPIKTSLFKTEEIALSSPRTGLIMIGEGHFMSRFNFDRSNSRATSNSYGRLSTFFHEARHSDGHGKNLGFLHALCPEGHDFADQNACDRNLNGPYAVGAQVTKEFLKTCEDCDDEVKERMKLSYLDSLNRIIKVTLKPIAFNNTEIQTLKFEIELIDILLSFQRGSSKEESLAERAQLEAKILAISVQEGKMEEIPSKYLDAAPEGLRFE